MECHSIPLPVVMNFDQTPLKYVPVANQTLLRKGSKYLVIKTQSFKEAFTATFGITFYDKFLPMQLIYGSKTKQSLLKVKFRDSFSLNVNEKHFSNTNESFKLIEDIVTLYAEKERDKLGLSDNQSAPVIFDVFFWTNDRFCHAKGKRKFYQGGKSTCQYEQPFSTTGSNSEWVC